MPISRRQVIIGASAATLAFAGVTAHAAAPQKIIVTGGHPGDPEYGCGGTIARLTGLGHQVTLLYLNDGGWPPTSSEARIAEAKKACEILHARPLYANQQNGHAILDNEHYEAFAKIIAAEQPDAVFTQWPIDNHRDHRAITALTYDAWNSSKRSFALYYYEVSDGEDTLQFSPTHYIDITATEPTKRAACYAHASQTPDRYYKLQDDVATFRGIESGYKRAEAFVLQQRSPNDPLQSLTARS
ncbi:MAG TPA: PIG-L family deacetylase [Acidobacteriaceae bacterium]|jgi:LmbE family N-acetylglucosaminyl deacetylase|nr:PIG-L family deacetylase [Acidobacteriaceae bacterium]